MMRRGTEIQDLGFKRPKKAATLGYDFTLRRRKRLPGDVKRVLLLAEDNKACWDAADN